MWVHLSSQIAPCTNDSLGYHFVSIVYMMRTRRDSSRDQTLCKFVTFKRCVRSSETIDIGVTNGLSFIVNLKEGVTNASILREVSRQKGNEGY